MTIYFGLVARFRRGDPYYAYADTALPPMEEVFCAGEFQTAKEAVQHAEVLRWLLIKGYYAYSNKSYRDRIDGKTPDDLTKIWRS